MKKWLRYLRSSFSARLSLWVTFIVTAIYVASLYLLFQFSLTVKDDSLESIMHSLIEADYQRLIWVANLIVAAGLLILLLVCRLLIDRNLRPLDTLAENVRYISERSTPGSMTPEQPLRIQYQGRKDEIGGLQVSFLTMQQTLDGYISEINQKTNTLKLRQKELESAYEHAQEYQHVKTAFLRNITQQLIPPVSTIHSLTTTIANNYQELSEEEIGRIRSEILLHTNEITLLIDQILSASQQTEADQLNSLQQQ